MKTEKNQSQNLTPPTQSPETSQNSDVSANNIEALAREASSVDSGTQLFKPEPRKRGPRGPYRKGRDASSSTSTTSQPPNSEAGAVQPPPAISSEEIVKPTVDVVDAWVAKIARNEKARMQKEEKDGICKSLGLLLDKYAPTVVEKYAPEMMALMAIGAYSTRVYAIMQHDSELRKQEYAAKVRAQQMHVVPDPTPDKVQHTNGQDHNPPPSNLPNGKETLPNVRTQSYPNPFGKLPGPTQ